MSKSKSFILPSGILKQHLIALGKTGSGKSSALRYIVEHLLRQKKRVCIVDPKGDWWGLKVDANGRGAGFPVVLFGEFKNPKARDVPINQASGKHIAELVASGNRPCVVGLGGWQQAAMTQFWTDFASTLFTKNAGELYLVVDEFHNFAPKGKILSPQAGVCLHWSNRLLSEGRGLGIVCLNASQRPQKVHNDSLTSHETLLAMRVVHKADRDAVKDWIDGNGDPEVGKRVLASIAGMPRGDAWGWSPEIEFGPSRITFPMFQTFDSFAPPQLQKRVSNKGWAGVDLAAVKEKLAAVIKEQEANDPKLLREQVQKLRADLTKAQQDKPAAATATAREVVKEKRVEVKVPVLKDGQLKRAESMLDRFIAALAKVRELATELKDAADPVASAIGSVKAPVDVPAAASMIVRRSPLPAPSAVRSPVRSTGIHVDPDNYVDRKTRGNGQTHRAPTPDHDVDRDAGEKVEYTSREQLNGPMKKILDAYAWWHSIGVAQPTRERIAPIAGYGHVRSRGFTNPLYACQGAGLIQDDALTQSGTALASWPDRVDSLAEYHVKLKKVLSGPERKLFDQVHTFGGKTTRDQLAAACDYGHVRSRGFTNPLYRLSGMGLVDLEKNGGIRATELFYPPSLLTAA